MSRKIVVDADALSLLVCRLTHAAYTKGWYANSLVNGVKAEEAARVFTKLEYEFYQQIQNKPTVDVQGFPDGVR